MFMRSGLLKRKDAVDVVGIQADGLPRGRTERIIFLPLRVSVSEPAAAKWCCRRRANPLEFLP
jgi:hypothetical protein